MHSAQGHTVVDERWRLQLAVAAVCRSLAPRPADSLAAMLASQPVSSTSSDAAPAATSYRALSYYTYRYL